MEKMGCWPLFAIAPRSLENGGCFGFSRNLPIFMGTIKAGCLGAPYPIDKSIHWPSRFSSQVALVRNWGEVMNLRWPLIFCCESPLGTPGVDHFKDPETQASLHFAPRRRGRCRSSCARASATPQSLPSGWEFPS